MSTPQTLLDRFTTMYGEPKTDDVAGYVETYANALEGFNAAILDAAILRIIRNHTYPSWPTVGECVKVCRQVASELYPPKIVPDPPPAAKDPVDAKIAKLLKDSALRALTARNSFEDIRRRCPIGGTIVVDAPWGGEVRDAQGNIVPIRETAPYVEAAE